MPAIAKVRLAAARMQSANNLKQIGLAAFNYNDAYGHFSSGCDDHDFSAAVQLLPYLEQAAVYQMVDQKKSVDDKANANARKIVIKTFLNPMDPVMTVKDDYGPTNYLFNAGSKPDLDDNDGIFFRDSKINFADITDGTSNTLVHRRIAQGRRRYEGEDVRRQYVLLKKDGVEGNQGRRRRKGLARRTRTSPATASPVGWTADSFRALSRARSV